MFGHGVLKRGTPVTRRSKLLGGTRMLVVLAVVALMATPVLGVHDLGLLCLDGNADDTGCTGPVGTTPVDWNSINPVVNSGVLPPLPPDADSRVFKPQCTSQLTANACVPAGTDAKTVEDPGTAANPGDGTYFTGGGSKDVNDINQWLWGGSSVPAKDEITNAYAVAFTNPFTVGQNLAGDTIVYFGMDRIATNGDATVAFWFFVKPVGLVGTSSGTFSGLHTAGVVAANGTITTVGDIQVISDFTTGGSVPEVIVRMWVGGNAGDPDHLRTDPAWSPNSPLQLLLNTTTADCNTPGLAGDLACATVNSSAVTAPWRYIPKSGSGTQFGEGAFFEGGLNLSRLVGVAGTAACVSSFMAQTRSATSVTAQLKDFALGEFNTCGKLTINKVTVPSGDTVSTFQYDTTGGLDPNEGANPEFSLEDGGTKEFVDVLPCPPATQCYSVTERDPSALGYTLTGLTCQVPSGGESTFTASVAQRQVTINVARGEAVSCTFTNTKAATLTVNKVLVPSNDTGLFNLQIDGSTAGTGANVGNGGTTGAQQVSIGSHTVGETAGTGTVLTDYTTVISGDCAANGSVTVAAGDNKVCTITNTRKPRLTVNKVLVPSNDTGLFNLQIDGNTAGTGANVGNGGTTGAQQVSIGSHTVGETAGTGTVLTDYITVISGDCAANGSVTVAAGDNKVCTITNTRFARIIVDKVSHPPGDSTSFQFNKTGTGYGPGSFNLTDGAPPNDSGLLAPGAYSVTEVVPLGWELTSLVCTSTNGLSTINTSAPPLASITLAAGDIVNCKFVDNLRFRIAVVVCTNEAVPQLHSSSVTLNGNTIPSASVGDPNTLCTPQANFNNVLPGSRSIGVNIRQNTANVPP